MARLQNGDIIDHGARGRRLGLRHWLVIWSDHANTVHDWLSVLQTYEELKWCSQINLGNS